jgi:hypothetical protein
MYHRTAPQVLAVVSMGMAWISILIFHLKVEFLGPSFLTKKLAGCGCGIQCVHGSCSAFESID